MVAPAAPTTAKKPRTKKPVPEAERCTYTNDDGKQCVKRGRVVIDGKRFCLQHHPDVIKAQRIAAAAAQTVRASVNKGHGAQAAFESQVKLLLGNADVAKGLPEAFVSMAKVWLEARTAYRAKMAESRK